MSKQNGLSEIKQEAQLSLEWADRENRLYPNASFRLSVAEKKRLPKATTAPYSDAGISKATINARIRYVNSAHVGDNCKQ